MSATDEDEVNLECFGYFQDKIVGIQYYQGEVNKNEMVTLTREPNNSYDRWAIRVDNVRGVMVGHLPAKLVCHLAPLVDAGLLHLEGLVPRGNNNVYSMPVHLYCFGEPDKRTAVMSRLRGAGLALMDPHAAPSGAKSPLAAGAGGGGGGSGSGAGRAGRLSARELEDSLDRLFKEMLDKTGPRELLDPDPEVTTQLFPHQKEALAWMCKRENSNSLPPFWEPRLGPAGGLTYVSQLTNFISATRPGPLRGGVLADDMGLGKTLEVIALVATNRPGVKYSQLGYYLEEEEQIAEEEEGGERPAKRQRKGKQAAAKAKKEAKPKEPKTKVGKLAAEAAALAAAQEAPATLPTASGPRGTLIVCPLSVLSSWQMQLEEHTRGSLKARVTWGRCVCVYYGQDRDRRVSSLAGHDVVLTTYNILAQEAGLKTGLLKVDWLRVVLDEAHTIKNGKTQTAKAAQGLRAERRWAITGTPIQNSLQDLHGLMAFLQLEPLHDKALFLRTIERPIKSGDPTGLLRLKVLLNTVALRRTKDLRVNGRPLVALPPRNVHLVTVQLSREERHKYERWEEAGQRIVQRHLSSDTLLQNYTAVLEIILRLRQICDHAALCPGEDPVFAAEATAGQALTPEATEMLIQLLKARSGLDDDCPICLSQMNNPCITVCKHIFCKRCIETVMARDKPSCPMCRGPISPAGLVELPEEEPPTQTQQQQGEGGGSPQKGGLPGQTGSGASSSSSKIAELMKRLKEAAGEGGAVGGGERPIKSVVFSQFTSMLDLLEPVLAAEGMSYVRLDGSTSAKKRGDLLRSFHSHAPGSPQVLIASLKAGGVGLNLTSASRVHLLDPWWNPSVEDQAMDRVHRLGQTRPVEVYRYACDDSIEERMIELQEQKRQLMKAAFERKREEDVRQMRINDVRLLMQL
ncbi:hypothetical protein N2152v2_008951 [Parachlorella kessleri]